MSADGERVVVVGGGLAGLSAGLHLAERGAAPLVLEAGAVVGGRTASWDADGMPVESGLHRFLGFFTELPATLERCGVALDDIVCWEDEVEIRVPDGGPQGILGLAPFRRPLKTLAGLVGNNALLSPVDKASLVPFIAAGLLAHRRDPVALDRWSVTDFAQRWKVTERAQRHLLVPLTAGIFFLPPERFSAATFFGLIGPNLRGLHRMRLGAFTCGMTEAMCEPMARAIRAASGEVRTGATVRRLEVRDGAVTGVALDDEVIGARHVVVATSIGVAQRLVGEALPDHPHFRAWRSMPTTPSVTLQLDLVHPITDVDRTVFGPGTALACFAEQSRTTFPRAGGRGRVSAILSPPEPYLDASVEELVALAVREGRRLGLDLEVERARAVRHPAEFPSLEPGHLATRLPQATPVPGLTLAGDHTSQPWDVTMEGAVASGRLAADAVFGATRGQIAAPTTSPTA